MRIVLEGKINDGDLARALFYQHVMRDGLRRIEIKRWATPASALDVAGAEELFAVAGIGWVQSKPTKREVPFVRREGNAAARTGLDAVTSRWRAFVENRNSWRSLENKRPPN